MLVSMILGGLEGGLVFFFFSFDIFFWAHPKPSEMIEVDSYSVVQEMTVSVYKKCLRPYSIEL